MLLRQGDIDDYRRGYQAAGARQAFPVAGSWWQQEGWNQAAAHWAPIALIVGQVPPDFQPFTPVSQADADSYWSAYESKVTNPADWWGRVGAFDWVAGRRNRLLRAGFPPPPFHEHDPSGPLPVGNQQPNQPAPTDVFLEPLYQLRQSDLTDYQTGWQSAAQRRAKPAGSWWVKEGFASQGAGRPQTLPSGSVNWSGITPLTAADIQQYQLGFKNGGAGVGSFWLRQGAGDARSGRGLQAYTANQPPAGFPVVIADATTTAPGDATRYLEVVAKEFGKNLPYDLAVNIQGLQAGLIGEIAKTFLSFDILGDAPGDNRLGYKLSGPNGPIAKWVDYLTRKGDISGDPADYGLPAWIGTYASGQGSTKGVRLLGRDELAQIGVLDRLEAAFTSPFNL